MTPGGDGERTLSTVLRGIAAHGVVLGPDLPAEHYDAFAAAVVEGLGQFGWGLRHDPGSLQATIDGLVATMPPIPPGEWLPRPPEPLRKGPRVDGE